MIAEEIDVDVSTAKANSSLSIYKEAVIPVSVKLYV